MTQDCIFCKIAAGEIPAKLVYQDEHVIAFHDIDPKAPVHVLIIPRRHIESLAALDSDDAETVGRLLLVADQIAQATSVAASGYRVTFNVGRDAGMAVYHLHAHLMGGRRLGWPPG
ncbi:MAG TPA: histidine triad nucleotide-binding protein [Anaerolineae bacterium]|nr:histidine triad nucleotide-binding protein [Anaerolineae bacterium]